MKISKQDLSNIFEAAGDFDNANRYADSARKALEAGTLEIEGYEKSEWIKFDRRDPKTFPPELTRVQVFDKESGDILTAKYDYDSHEWSLSWCMITHWRPLPETPKEMEEAK